MSSILQLNQALHQYVTDHLDLNSYLKQLLAKTATLKKGPMATLPDQIALLSFLIKTTQAQRVIEIGVFTGCATLGMALALPENGKIIACDIDYKACEIGKYYWQAAGVDHKIDLRIAPALETLNSLIKLNINNNLLYDLIFIDADKINYPNYYSLSCQLLKPGGIMVFDNMLWSGQVIDLTVQDSSTIAIRKTLDLLKNDKQLDVSIVTVGDGMALARKR